MILFKLKKKKSPHHIYDIQTHMSCFGFHRHLNLSGLVATFPIFIHSLPDELYLIAGELRRVQEVLNMLLFMS